MLYQAVVKELVGLPNVGLVVSLYFVQDCSRDSKKHSLSIDRYEIISDLGV